MSNDVPPSGPASPEPDPFAELLRGLADEPTAPQPTAPPANVPAGILPPTQAFDPFPPTVAVPPSVSVPPESVVAPPTIAFGQPTAPTTAYWESTAPTVAYGQASAAAVPPPATSQAARDFDALIGVSTGAPTSSTADPYGPAALPTGVPPEPPMPTGRKVFIGILIAVAAILVVVIAVLLVVLLSGSHQAQTPAAGGTPTTAPATPVETPATTDDPPAPAAPAAIASFAASPAIAKCAGTGSVVTIKLGWSVTGAATTTDGENEIALASSATAVDDATQAPYQNALDADQDGFPMSYICSNPSWTYTLTAIGTDGKPVTEAVTVHRALTPKPTPTPAPTQTADTGDEDGGTPTPTPAATSTDGTDG